MFTNARPTVIDPRGARFAAGLTSVVLAAALLTMPSLASGVLLAWQVLAFGLGVGLGPASGPYAWVFRRLVRPRLGVPKEMEPAAPPRFAQGVGLAFTVVAGAGLLAGAGGVAVVATAFALMAALLNAVFGLCLGCKLYVLILRARSLRV